MLKISNRANHDRGGLAGLGFGPAVAMALLGLAQATHAATDVSVAIDDCTGTRQTATTPRLVLECSGNFMLANGTITSDVELVISGESNLTLMNVRIEAPAISLRSNGSLALGSGSVLVSPGNVTIQASSNGAPQPSATIAPGATLSVPGGAPSQLVQSTGRLVGASASAVSPNASVGTSVDLSARQPKSGGGALGLVESAVMLAAGIGAALHRARRIR